VNEANCTLALAKKNGLVFGNVQPRLKNGTSRPNVCAKGRKCFFRIATKSPHFSPVIDEAAYAWSFTNLLSVQKKGPSDYAIAVINCRKSHPMRV
jgi:hypothetical protein